MPLKSAPRKQAVWRTALHKIIFSITFVVMALLAITIAFVQRRPATIKTPVGVIELGTPIESKVAGQIEDSRMPINISASTYAPNSPVIIGGGVVSIGAKVAASANPSR